MCPSPASKAFPGPLPPALAGRTLHRKTRPSCSGTFSGPPEDRASARAPEPLHRLHRGTSGPLASLCSLTHGGVTPGSAAQGPRPRMRLMSGPQLLSS